MCDRGQTSPQQQATPVFGVSDRTKTIAEYTIGPRKKPSNIDLSRPGPDAYKARPATAEDYTELAKWKAKLVAAQAAQGVPNAPHNNIPEGIATYYHYLYGDGADRWFSYEKYVTDDKAGRKTLESAITDACSGAEKLYFQNYYAGEKKKFDTGLMIPPVKYDITGTAIGAGGSADWGKFPYPETENWQKALGSHYIWMSGKVTATLIKDGKPQFKMDFTLHAVDKYQFVAGLSDITSGAPDADNVRFEVTGSAKPYMHYSYLTRTVTWAGEPTASVTAATANAGQNQQVPANSQADRTVSDARTAVNMKR